MSSLEYTDEEMQLALLMDNVEESFNIETKDGRIIVQKLTYLAREFGYIVNKDYVFNWYINGPYCPQLTRNYYSLRGKLLDGIYDFIGQEITEDEKETVRKLKYLIGKKPKSIKLADWLELIASIDFLYKRYSDKNFVLKCLKDDPNKKHLVLDKNFENAYSAMDGVLINVTKN